MKSVKNLFLLLFLISFCLYIISNSVVAEQGGKEGFIIYTKPVKAVIFNHNSHSQDYAISCDTCHDKLFQMQALNAEKNPDFNHNGFSQGKYCGACHDGKNAFAMDKQCTRCHIGVKGLNRFLKK
jgi:c(7)-type cytochrome triheme protein